MPSQRANGKAQKRSGKLQELKERREQVEKKRAQDLTSKPAAKMVTSIAEKPRNQVLVSSLAKPFAMSSLPCIRKVKGTSKAEKKAKEEAVAAAKKKREMEEREEGEIDSDDDEGMLTGHMNDHNQSQRHTPASNKTNKAKPAAQTIQRPPDRTRDETKSGNSKNNGARDVKNPQPEALKFRNRPQNLQKPKELDVKTSSAKRTLFDSDDSSSSDGKIFKPTKKQKTTKAGMDFENLPTKRKHVEEEEEPPRDPVKKQKITEEVKKPVKKPATVPVKRAPIVKETKYRMID
ncbi:predicted protein [Sclerotinia sclerotiorum 1980 UF-70]|uniref:Uncharacterized protein n=2 Tax=Sclerotinia sclerotiorum (strain ATCC 18683 / 1980 / Ss-1) TaxID=665079 RepID=A7E5D3_SCLS1|nr:predicted protein [Sclerotinia sclerotiorum 1980 UF-70]APA07884.1 hypothetical protein sscle_03g026540 [Sclerotinia sclerotiorum 1980 UF-70]EDN91105.1 predicted protein [Sclerotinia sclerotiorum 1980 UF-70]